MLLSFCLARFPLPSAGVGLRIEFLHVMSNDSLAVIWLWLLQSCCIEPLCNGYTLTEFEICKVRIPYWFHKAHVVKKVLCLDAMRRILRNKPRRKQSCESVPRTFVSGETIESVRIDVLQSVEKNDCSRVKQRVRRKNGWINASINRICLFASHVSATLPVAICWPIHTEICQWNGGYVNQWNIYFTRHPLVGIKTESLLTLMVFGFLGVSWKLLRKQLAFT